MHTDQTREIINMGSFPPAVFFSVTVKTSARLTGYERHVVVHHPDLPGYPGPADIQLYGLKKQWMS
jgi:hypothetical protein